MTRIVVLEFIAVRHGPTVSNIEGKLNGVTDWPLDASAHDLLISAGRQLTEYPIQRVLVSPMLRARQSAEIICSLPNFRNVDVEVLETLRELDFGLFEGCSRDQLLASELRAQYRAWMSLEPSAPSPPGGESWESAMARARGVLARITRDSRTCMIIGHGYLLRLMIVVAIGGLPPQSVWQFPMQSAAWSWLDRQEEIWRLRRHNVLP